MRRVYFEIKSLAISDDKVDYKFLKSWYQRSILFSKFITKERRLRKIIKDIIYSERVYQEFKSENN